MKKCSVIVLSSAALALAGCGNQGGSTDQYNTKSGTSSSTNRDLNSTTNNYEGGTFGRPLSGAGSSANSRGLDTNDQGGATSPLAIDSGGQTGQSGANSNRFGNTNNYQGGATSPGSTNIGAGSRTNYPGLDTNNIESGVIKNTNNAPEK